MKSIYINPEGIVCYLPDCPEEPERSDYEYYYEIAWANTLEKHRKALAAAKQSAVPFEDQQQGRDLICYELYGGPQVDIPWHVTVKSHSDKIFDFPSGWEVEMKSLCHSNQNWDCQCTTFQECTEQVAVLIPPPTSEQEEESQEELTALDLKMFIEQELGGYKTVHIGRSYRVINRQFVYESDIMSLAEGLLKNFTITRNLKENQ